MPLTYLQKNSIPPVLGNLIHITHNLNDGMNVSGMLGKNSKARNRRQTHKYPHFILSAVRVRSFRFSEYARVIIDSVSRIKILHLSRDNIFGRIRLPVISSL